MLPNPADTRATLLDRLRDDQDLAAWEEVMAIYGPLVLRIARKQGLQEADAEDVVQEVFSAVLSSINRWLDQPSRSGFRRWLIGISRNISLNIINRKPKGGIGQGGTTGLEELAELSRDSFDIESEFDQEYQRQVYQWAARRIQKEVSAATWIAFQETHLHGKPIEEVAQQLGIKTSNVYVARSRVMKRLRELVKEFLDG